MKNVVFAAALMMLPAFTAGKNTRPAYQVVHGWPILPEGRVLGQTTAVAVDSHGDIWVFHRAERMWTEPLPTDPIKDDTVAIFDARTGHLKRTWGANLFAMPHGLTIDRHDNVWLTDLSLQQVFKFSPSGKLLFAVGERGVAGNDEHHFNRPTDVAVTADGGFYVSDGYINTRIMKFDANGHFQFQWGHKGTGPGEFDLPHAVALDSAGRVYVADRSNARVQVFDGKGNYLSQWKSADLGRPYSLAVVGNDRAVVVDGGDQPDHLPDRSGAAVVDLSGHVLSKFGRYGNQDGQFDLAHDVIMDKQGAIYIVDTWGQRVQKFVPSRRAH